MDDAIAGAKLRWPNVPACHGWLSLDRRGAWRLKSEVVRHEGLARFLSRNYGPDERGNWLVRNGPQRVYVDLDYLPCVARSGVAGGFVAHTGVHLGDPVAVWLDDEGSVLLRFPAAVALLDDRDLAGFLDDCRFDGESPTHWRTLGMARLLRTEVPARFGFNPRPAPE